MQLYSLYTLKYNILIQNTTLYVVTDVYADENLHSVVVLFLFSSKVDSIMEFFHRGSIGELAKPGGGKTSELLCNELWRISRGNANTAT